MAFIPLILIITSYVRHESLAQAEQNYMTEDINVLEMWVWLAEISVKGIVKCCFTNFPKKLHRPPPA